MLVLLVSKLGIYKRIGQLCCISAEKSVLKGFTLLRQGDFTKCNNTCGYRYGMPDDLGFDHMKHYAAINNRKWLDHS